MNDHLSPGAGCACASWVDARDARRQGRDSLTALKRLESDPLKVREDTRHRVRRALPPALPSWT